MSKNEMKDIIRFICEMYIKEAEQQMPLFSKESWWSGYHKGQKNLAEHILKKLEEYK